MKKLTPSDYESSAAKNHRASIEACLKKRFGMRRFFRTGSFGNGTSISGYSDIDYFASIPREKLKKQSNNSLAHVRAALKFRFPNTNVSVRCPAVKIPFGLFDSETIEVVPSDFICKTQSGHHVYDIPDCSGGWMRSSPDAHNAYVRRADQRLDGKLKPLIRFIKAWRCYRSVPISSFYLELRITKYVKSEPTIIYSMDVQRVFTLLFDLQLARLQDPIGISGYVAPCKTATHLEHAKSKLLTAVVRAEKAREAEEAGNIKDAFYWWRLLYGEQFPTYYYS